MRALRLLLSSHGAALFGAERVLLALARGLAARGHEVTLELPHGGPALEAAQQLEGVHVLLSNRPRLPRTARELIRFATGFTPAVRALRATIRTGDYDVVWSNSLFNPIGALAARGTDANIVWHLHERNFRGAAGRVAAHWIARHCDRAIAPSRFVAESFTAAGGLARMQVVPNALLEPIAALPHHGGARPFTVGYLGQFEPRKRAPDVVAAVARLEDVSALLIGDGKARAAVERDVARFRLAARVHLTGFQRDIRPFLARCDCMVIPSRDEPFGLVALEAMAAGLPVVAADSGALPEVLGDVALYYPPGDIAALAACLRRLRAEPALGQSLRTRGLERVREYALDRMLDHVEAVIDDVVARNRTRQVHEVVA